VIKDHHLGPSEVITAVQFNDQSEPWRIAIMNYGADMLARFRQMDFDQRQKVLDEAVEISMREPLHFCHEPQFTVPSWGNQKLSGGQVAALMVFGLWVQCGEDEKAASGLIIDWGPEIKQACAVAALREQNTGERGEGK